MQLLQVTRAQELAALLSQHYKQHQPRKYLTLSTPEEISLFKAKLHLSWQHS